MNDVGEDNDVLAERIRQLDTRIAEKFKSEKELRDKLETMMNERLQAMNEFRHQLDRQSATFVTWWNLFLVIGAVITLSVSFSTFVVKFIWK